MTTEVAILNREAVALAADSAVTLVGLEDLKIYNINKLFSLSSIAPVAVMIYGSADFGTVPWETIVHEYRHEFASTYHDTIEDCALDFMEHLASFVQYTSEQKQKEQAKIVAMAELQKLRARVQETIEARSIDELLTDLLQSLVLEYINDRINGLKKMDSSTEVEMSTDREEISLLTDGWTEFVDKHLNGLPINDEIIQMAGAMVEVSLQVLPLDIWLPWRSGVVITGFGKNQLFPGLLHYSVDGVIAGTLRTRQLDNEQITEQQPSYIKPFAQDDMILTFLYGVDPAYTELLRRYRISRDHFYKRMVVDLVQDFEDRVGSSLSNEERSDLLDKMEHMKVASLQELDNPINSYQSEHYKDICSMVEWLPKDELAEAAETLVNLTSFKRRITPQAETVGGPIDVAVVSKSDGFIWIKRKNYFEPKLNPRFLERAHDLRTDIQVSAIDDVDDVKE